MIGDVPRSRLSGLYREHDVFVFPSLIESYGHPLVEAMACGLPVVASRIPASVEVCGDAAVYFDPASAWDLAGRIEEVIASRELRLRLRTAGLSRVSRMNFGSHVERLLEIFERVARRPRRA